MAWASLVRANEALPNSIIPRNAVGGVIAISRQGMARFKNGKIRSGDAADNNRQKSKVATRSDNF